MSPRRLAYPVTVFLSAFLLFQVQFIAAKRLLPWFGGVPAVWTTCMLFFQVLLLLGYAYAHLASARLGAGKRRAVHAALVALSLLAVLARVAAGGPAVIPGLGSRPTDPGSPVRQILAILLGSVGLPYFVLSTTGPLLQSWYAASQAGGSPYRLYAWSNLGSLLALVTYPFVVEPLLSLRAQGAVWAGGYIVFAAAVILVAIREPGAAVDSATPATAGRPVDGTKAPDASLRALWLGLAAGPSILFLAVTNQMCQEVAVIPLLWVLPLGLYLLSLVLCFESDRAYRRSPWSVALVLSAAGTSAILAKGPSAGVPLQIAVLSAVLLSAAMVCHGELSRLKPGPRHLTSFYMAVATGGAAGGIFVGLVAPRLFRAFWELPLGLWGCGLLFMAALARDKASAFHAGPVLPSAVGLMVLLLASPLVVGGGTGPILGVGAAVAAVALLALARRTVPAGTLVRVCTAATWLLIGCDLLGQALASVVHARWVTRNFYGTLRVDERKADTSGEEYFALKHGQVTHGVQYRAPALEAEPRAYFGRASGVGLAIRALRDRAAGRPLRVGVVGLGVGTLAAYGEPRDELRFYEINPTVIELARGRGGFFRFLRDTPATVSIAPGDARISLEREGSPLDLDLLAVDAFNSDSIPVHLLTREALEVYLRHLRNPEGLLALHLSNRFLELRPVALALARDRGLAWASISAAPARELEFPSVWALLTRDEALLSTPLLREAMDRGAIAPGPLWSDDHSDLLRALR
jgi:hypothetical protein